MSSPVAKRFERPTTLSQRLKSLRQIKKLSLRDVGRLSDGAISSAYLSQIEHGRVQRPSAIMLHRLARAYDVEFVELMELAVAESPASDPDMTVSTLGTLTLDEEQQLLRYLRWLRHIEETGDLQKF